MPFDKSGCTYSIKVLKNYIMTFVKVNNRPFGNLLNDFLNEVPGAAVRSFGQDLFAFPQTNIHETPEAFHLELNVPGRSKEDFKIHVEEGLLTISFESKDDVPSQDGYKTIRREFEYKSFKRSFSLDDKVAVDGIQAKYENGVLKLLLPKKEESKPSTRQISVA
jgi:HSP20 family protein